MAANPKKLAGSLTISPRFNGPADSANGGYTAGCIARYVDSPVVEVTLRFPPPLNEEMSVWRGDGVELLNGTQPIAQGRPSELQLEIPEPVSLEEARVAEPVGREFCAHNTFRTCFVCGVDRDPTDGMHLFAGPVANRGVFAANWQPRAEFELGGEGEIDPRIVWAALDCPTYPASTPGDMNPPVALLGRLTGSLVQPVRVGEDHLVMSWPLGAEGRKRSAGSAVFTADGVLCAFASALWITLKS